MQFTVETLETSSANFTESERNWITDIINQLLAIQPGWYLDGNVFRHLENIVEFQHTHTYTDVTHTGWAPTSRQTSSNKIY